MTLLNRNRSLLGIAVLALAACSETPTTPNAPLYTASTNGLKQDRVAVVDLGGRHPALFVQNADGSDRRQIHFGNVKDRIEGNFAGLAITDEGILALGPLKWSPDGQQLAVVVTAAFDQSEVIVMDADGHNQRAASSNWQIILSDVDWSPDSKAIAYAMSTLPAARGVDVFMTDLVKNEVRRLTTGQNLFLTELRWDSEGSGVYFSKVTGEDERPVSNLVNRILRVDVASGAIRTLAEQIVGTVQGIARDGSFALTLRNVSFDGARYDRELLRVGPTGHGEPTGMTGDRLMYADLSASDRGAIVVVNESDDPYSSINGFRRIAFDGPVPARLERLGTTTWSVDVAEAKSRE
jgi:dipeptidyl aminopeptidase/acylaminoacyl peptidase